MKFIGFFFLFSLLNFEKINRAKNLGSENEHEKEKGEAKRIKQKKKQKIPGLGLKFCPSIDLRRPYRCTRVDNRTENQSEAKIRCFMAEYFFLYFS